MTVMIHPMRRRFFGGATTASAGAYGYGAPGAGASDATGGGNDWGDVGNCADGVVGAEDARGGVTEAGITEAGITGGSWTAGGGA